MVESRIKAKRGRVRDPANMLIKLGRKLREEDSLKTAEEAISILKDTGAVRELQCIARFASGKAAIRAVSALGELRAVKALGYLTKYASDDVAKASIVALESLEAGRELGYVALHRSCRVDAGDSDIELVRMAISALENIEAVLPLERLKRYGRKCNELAYAALCRVKTKWKREIKDLV